MLHSFLIALINYSDPHRHELISLHAKKKNDHDPSIFKRRVHRPSSLCFDQPINPVIDVDTGPTDPKQPGLHGPWDEQVENFSFVAVFDIPLFVMEYMESWILVGLGTGIPPVLELFF